MEINIDLLIEHIKSLDSGVKVPTSTTEYIVGLHDGKTLGFWTVIRYLEDYKKVVGGEEPTIKTNPRTISDSRCY